MYLICQNLEKTSKNVHLPGVISYYEDEEEMVKNPLPLRWPPFEQVSHTMVPQDLTKDFVILSALATNRHCATAPSGAPQVGMR